MRSDRRIGAPRGLLGMLALVALVEATLGRVDLGGSNPDGVHWRYKARSAVREAPGCSILFLGDSQVKYGVDARAIEARMGRRVCNLALLGGPPSASFFQLRRALEAGARPEAVAVDFTPHLLDWDLRYCAQLWPEAADLRDCLDLGLATRDASFAGAVALARLLPSVRDRLGLRARLASALRRGPRGRVAWKNWDVDASGRRNPRLRPGADLVASIARPDGWACSATNAGYVRKFLDLAASKGLRVYWLIPPFDPEATRGRGRAGLDAAYTRFVREIQAGYPDLTVVDGRASGFGRSLFADPIHLNPAGALAFSEAVAGVLGRPDGVGQPRWVDLPARLDLSRGRGD